MKREGRIYRSWWDMKRRCFDATCHNYPNYGGRGITVCDRWRDSFDAFVADMGEMPAGMTLDRIDTNGNYEPGNCRWADRAEQRRNQRDCQFLEMNGERKTPQEWARVVGLNAESIRYRKRRGMSDVEALTTPRRNNNNPAGISSAARTKEST